ncbi:unnamed protein product [Oikopleura dioica]|uniref:ApaG domain-containing protein n=1 Tax=Oikopleura dioica TaxID=34765 RepID=E4X407_OIKDI|nr:unnamed protein product [Oikopleura dioica]
MLRRSNVFKNILRTSFQEKVVYTPVGAISSDLPAGKYLPGQFFIAKNYEYRGLVLLSQETEVIGENVQLPKSFETSYMVLCDERDTMDSKSQIDYLDYFLNDGEVTYTMNIDILPHREIIPAGDTNVTFQNQVADFYFKKSENPWPTAPNNPKLVPTSNLLSLTDKRNIKLKKYVKVTNNVRVSVIPIYLGQGFIRDRRISGESFSRNDFIKSRHYWQYHITLENLSNEPLELIERLWYIYEDNESEEGESSEGSLKRVAGRGVVGKHPILFNATQPFKYTSTLDISTGKGHMWGKFIFESRLDGRPVEVFVPKFELSSVVDYADY